MTARVLQFRHKVEVVVPPPGARVGDRIRLFGFDNQPEMDVTISEIRDNNTVQVVCPDGRFATITLGPEAFE